MHIPDGYLSPITSISLYTVCTPFLIKASREAKKELNNKALPLISLFSALSFLIMMFNIPLPGGTTGHAVGAVIAAIVLGPWVAMLSLTCALVIQALFFGDGGILTLGANIFNIAIVMTLSGYATYRLLDKWSRNEMKRKIIFSAVAGYVAINLAALLVGFELGIQSILFRSPSGQSLYFPYGLGISLTAMMVSHLTIGGLAEGLVTALALFWILKTHPGIINKKEIDKKKDNRFFKKSFSLLGLLIVISPIGLLAPGTAWGEWGREELVKLGLGYIPTGFDKWTSFWQAPIPDYSIIQIGNPTISYIFSGLLGVFLTLLLIFGVYWLSIKIFRSGEKVKLIMKKSDDIS